MAVTIFVCFSIVIDCVKIPTMIGQNPADASSTVCLFSQQRVAVVVVVAVQTQKNVNDERSGSNET